MAQPYEFTVDVTTKAGEVGDEDSARASAWDSARAHVGTGTCEQLSQMTLVDDGYRLIDGVWVRFWSFTILAS